MEERYCNACNMKKDIKEFTKCGKECTTCKKERIQKARDAFYTNRQRCVCGLYYCDANPKEKHERTQAHQNFMKYGVRNPDHIDFLYRTGHVAHDKICYHMKPLPEGL